MRESTKEISMTNIEEILSYHGIKKPALVRRLEALVKEEKERSEIIGRAKEIETTLMWPDMAFWPGSQPEILGQPITKKLARNIHENAIQSRDNLLRHIASSTKEGVINEKS
jgi:hypothetical protein